MDQSDDLWAAIRRVLPDPEAFAAAVAAELGEPLDDVRLSVLIGTIALNGQLGPEAAATAAIEAELLRLQSVQGAPPVAFSRSTRSTTFWPRPSRSASRDLLTSTRSLRSSVLREQPRRGPIARWSPSCTATQ